MKWNHLVLINRLIPGLPSLLEQKNIFDKTIMHNGSRCDVGVLCLEYNIQLRNYFGTGAIEVTGETFD